MSERNFEPEGGHLRGSAVGWTDVVTMPFLYHGMLLDLGLLMRYGNLAVDPSIHAVHPQHALRLRPP
jgi:hypothetical protein